MTLYIQLSNIEDTQQLAQFINDKTDFPVYEINEPENWIGFNVESKEDAENLEIAIMDEITANLEPFELDFELE